MPPGVLLWGSVAIAVGAVIGGSCLIATYLSDADPDPWPVIVTGAVMVLLLVNSALGIRTAIRTRRYLRRRMRDE